MDALQLRLQQPEAVMVAASAGLSDNERIVAELRSLEAEAKQLDARIKDLKEQIRELVADGEVVGSAEVGGVYTFSERTRTTFDAEGAMKAGMLHQSGEWAPFWKSSTSTALVFKPIKEEAK